MGSNFHMLSGAGSRHDPYALDSNPDLDLDLENGGLFTDSDSDEDYSEDSDMYEAEDMMINVQVDQISTGRVRTHRAEVMYTVPAAVLIYRELLGAGFPLHTTTMVRYGLEGEIYTDTSPDFSLVLSPTSEQPGLSSATSVASHNERDAHIGRDYIFDWGKYAGQAFLDVPENYLRTLGGQLDVYEVKHPGLKQAFEYHRPGQARSAPKVPPLPTAPQQQLPRRQTRQTKQTQQPQSVSRPPFPRSNVKSSSDIYKFTKGPHKGKKIGEVPENYLRTLEGMPRVIEKWPGFVPALQDFNRKMGRAGKI
jgi:hypothetical protein